MKPLEGSEGALCKLGWSLKGLSGDFMLQVLNGGNPMVTDFFKLWVTIH